MIYHGSNWQAGAALPSGATTSAGQSAGGAVANSSSKARAVIAAYESGAITYSQLCSAFDAIDKSMAVPYASAGGLGISSHAQAMAWYQAKQQQAQMQALTAVSSAPPHKPTELKSEGIRAGEIIAWRAWNIRGDDLISIVAEGKPWSINQPMQGDPATGYGVHAYKNPHGPVLDEYVTRSGSTSWVIGEVALWGDVIEHEEGYRAEFARVHSLVTWSQRVPKEQRDRISKAYLTAPVFKVDDAA